MMQLFVSQCIRKDLQGANPAQVSIAEVCWKDPELAGSLGRGAFSVANERGFGQTVAVCPVAFVRAIAVRVDLPV